MDENIVKFQEKLRELVSLGKKKKGILEIQEINDFFSDMELDSDQMEKVLLMCSESVMMTMIYRMIL